VDEVGLPARHGISRARLFIQLADECVVADNDMHKAFIDAVIVFRRTAMNRLQIRCKGCDIWNDWYDPLLENPSVLFIKSERDFVIHEVPSKVNQVIHAGLTRPEKTKHSYYYENSKKPAIDTVLAHTEEIKNLIRECEMKFGADGIMRA